MGLSRGGRVVVPAVLAAAIVAAGVAAGGVTSAATACSAGYAVVSQWPGGFQAAVTATNLGEPLSGWTLGFDFPDAGQAVAQGWSATWTQTGRSVTASNLSWNAQVDTGGTVSPGFIGSFTTANPFPGEVTVNGVPCSGTGSGPTSTESTPPAGNTFTNPIDLHAPDPWLQYYDGYYYLAATTWNSTITMRRARTLGGLASAPDTVVFTLTRPNGAGTMWAPEFHLLDGPDGRHWYLYYVAGREPYDLGSQRIHVLESAGLDPMGPYTFKADLLDPAQDTTWELDPTILHLDGKLYLLGTYYDGSQPMFIRPMSNPWTASGTRHLLAAPRYAWETIGGAVNEAPEVLQHGGRTFIIYSASHCSTPDYALGMLTYTGGDPLASTSWAKSPDPVFRRSDADGVFGPGHNGFFSSPDGTQSWIVYHANTSAAGGCDMNRSARAQQFSWKADGTPDFGVPVRLGTTLPAPAGEPAAP